jgi:hypothetical protein
VSIEVKIPLDGISFEIPRQDLITPLAIVQVQNGQPPRFGIYEIDEHDNQPNLLAIEESRWELSSPRQVWVAISKDAVLPVGFFDDSPYIRAETSMILRGETEDHVFPDGIDPVSGKILLRRDKVIRVQLPTKAPLPQTAYIHLPAKFSDHLVNISQ